MVKYRFRTFKWWRDKTFCYSFAALIREWRDGLEGLKDFIVVVLGTIIIPFVVLLACPVNAVRAIRNARLAKNDQALAAKQMKSRYWRGYLIEENN